jgi:ankyrin repeat protein
MFPNPQDVLPLPLRPNLEQYKKLAKDLVHACKSGDAGAIRTWAAGWIKALMRLAGPTATRERPGQIDRWVDQLEEFARRQLSDSAKANCVLADAQFVIARAQGFESWQKFAKHVEGLARPNSAVAKFELAADAIVSGDIATLERFLRESPHLIHARSTREHRATLLHYVAANGVENYRQKTPPNAAQIAEILLKHGAEVDADADVYGGGATTLELAATSIHPEQAGVQEALMQTLLDRGAAIDRPASAGNRHSAVVGCLANGRGMAAEYLAQHGAQLDLEGAAGVGQLDVAQSFFNDDGSLKAGSTRIQMERGFLWACEYGRDSVIEFLLTKGIALNTEANTGETGLHWAVVGGRMETIKLLIARGASLETKNAYGGTALGQAIWSAVNSNDSIDYVPIIETLIDAGAKIEDGSLAWLAEQTADSASVKERVAQILRNRGAKS